MSSENEGEKNRPELPGIRMTQSHGNTVHINSPGQVVPIDMEHSNGNLVTMNAPTAEVAALQISTEAALVREFTHRLVQITPPVDAKTFNDLASAAHEVLAGGEKKDKAIDWLKGLGGMAANETVKGLVAWLLKNLPT